jgi:5'-3' exonuclease
MCSIKIIKKTTNIYVNIKIKDKKIINKKIINKKEFEKEKIYISRDSKMNNKLNNNKNNIINVKELESEILEENDDKINDIMKISDFEKKFLEEDYYMCEMEKKFLEGEIVNENSDEIEYFDEDNFLENDEYKIESFNIKNIEEKEKEKIEWKDDYYNWKYKDILPNRPFLLIDSSYVSFHRFFSTQIWYSKQFPDENYDENYDWSTNKIFIDRYDKYYLSSIDKIRQRYNIPYENIIIVRDCPRETIWRLDDYQEYKSNRKNTCKFQNKKYNIGNIFKHIYQELYPKLYDDFGIKFIKVERAEADDVIAVITKKIHELDSTHLIVIITNDNDYLQLVNNHVLIWSLQNKLLNMKIKDTPEKELLLKIICGDVSDNISSCFDGETILNYNELIEDENKLREVLQTNKKFKDKFIKNKNLIDFNMIPIELKNNILEYSEKMIQYNLLKERRKFYYSNNYKNGYRIDNQYKMNIKRNFLYNSKYNNLNNNNYFNNNNLNNNNNFNNNNNLNNNNYFNNNNLNNNNNFNNNFNNNNNLNNHNLNNNNLNNNINNNINNN